MGWDIRKGGRKAGLLKQLAAGNVLVRVYTQATVLCNASKHESERQANSEAYYISQKRKVRS